MNKIRNVAKLMAVCFGVIFIITLTIYAYRQGKKCSGNSRVDYTEQIRVLTDTISKLRKDIETYQDEIDSLSLESEKIKEEIGIIIRSNEETNHMLANGSWDDNIRFFTEFLSKEDSTELRHSVGDNKAPIDKGEQGNK